jgi:hypothetical protein
MKKAYEKAVLTGYETRKDEPKKPGKQKVVRDERKK